MWLEISAGAWMSWFLGRRTQERSRRSPQGRPGHRRARCGEVSWSRWLTRAWRSPRSAPPNNPGSPRDQLVTVVTLVITAWKSQLPPTTNRAYARGICEGIVVRAGELSLCAGRICVASAGESYALALLVIGALGESVSLSDKTKPGRCCHRKDR